MTDWRSEPPAKTRRELFNDIQDAMTTCGSCADWMTRECPRERLDDTAGLRCGPSMMSIKCESFRMTTVAEKYIAGLRARREAMPDDD